jgi:hypothetical protein
MVFLSWLVPPQAEAAEIERHATGPASVAISVDGEIVEGDGKAFESVISRTEAQGYSVSVVLLNSIGGSLFEGIDIARTIRKAAIKTVVASAETCASVCFFAFAAGSTRTVYSGARVGVHAAANELGQETPSSSAGTAAMGRIAEILGLPSAIVARIIATPSSQIFWLTKAHFAEMGAVITDKEYHPYWR